ncbi:MAG: glycosyltransferase [Thermoplasmata archaeon]|nr:glycosyltransferase [Thermoplasmata archaeon]
MRAETVRIQPKGKIHPPGVRTVGEPPLTSRPGVSLVIPAWNEEARLPRTLARYLPALEARGAPYEVIVVTEGVEDRTAQVADSFGGRNVRLLRFAQRLGKGGAIMAGVQASQYDSVGYVDADGPVEPGDLLAMVDALATADAVVASRRVPGSRPLQGQPWNRRVAGALWSALVRSTLFLPVRDTQCGAKFFRRAVLLEALEAVAIKNWAFDVSLLYHLWQDDRSIREMPVTWSHDLDSHLVLSKTVPIMLLSLMGLWVMNLGTSRRPTPAWIHRFALRFAAG